MANAILDINISRGYPYEFNIDLDDINGVDIETDYTCFFECGSIGKLQYSLSQDQGSWELVISSTDTNKLTTNLEEYVVYTVKTSDGTYDKLLSGRIHIDERIRS